MDKMFSFTRPITPKKFKTSKQKYKELRAKKNVQHLDIPKIVEIWTPEYVEAEQYTDCDGGGYDFEEWSLPCGTCHACTRTFPPLIEVGEVREYVLVY